MRCNFNFNFFMFFHVFRAYNLLCLHYVYSRESKYSQIQLTRSLEVHRIYNRRCLLMLTKNRWGRRWHKADERYPGQWFVMQTNVQRSSSCLFQRANRVVLPRLTLFRRGRRVSRNSRADRHGRQFSKIDRAHALKNSACKIRNLLSRPIRPIFKQVVKTTHQKNWVRNSLIASKSSFDTTRKYW